jgi:hypothetical protein
MVVLATILVTNTILPAFAIQLDTLLLTRKDQAEALTKAINLYYIEYPNGGKLQSMLQNVNDEIAFTADRNTPSVQELMNKINDNLVREKNSPVTVEDIKIDFKAILKGDERRAVLEHNLKMDMMITRFVLGPSGDEGGTLIDLNWRGMHVDDPVVIKTEKYGDVEINIPTGYFQLRHPEVLKLLENTDAVKVLTTPTIDFRELTDLKIDKWDWLFDPTGSIKEAEEFEFEEVEGAKLITFFAYGASSVETGAGVIREKVSKANVQVDGTEYIVRSTSPPSSASIQITGYAEERLHGADESAIVFETVPESASKSYTGGFPIVVLAVLGGMMGAVAGFVLWRTSRKEKD